MVNIAKIILRVVFGIFYHVSIINKENLPEKGPVLLCANHVNELDMFFIGYKIKKRYICWMAKEELFKNPILSWWLKQVGAFPVKRGKADIDSIKTAMKLLAEGHIIGIFPEGTRKKEGKILKAKHGAALIAVKSAVPIIPVAIESRYKPFSRIRVVFGEPFKLETEKDKKYTNEEMDGISRGIMEKIYNLL